MCDVNTQRLSMRLWMPFSLPRHPNSAFIGASVHHSRARVLTHAITQHNHKFTQTDSQSHCTGLRPALVCDSAAAVF